MHKKFREAENGFPKAFLLTSSTDAYRTLCEHFVVHHRDALLVFALRRPCRSYTDGAVDVFDRIGQKQWLTCVFHRLTACRQEFVYTLSDTVFCIADFV